MSYRWAILTLGVVAQAAFSATQQGLAVLAPALRERFDLSLQGVGAVLAASSAGTVATLLAWGLVTDRLGERAVIGVGLGVTGVAFGVAALSSGLGLLVAMLVAAGMFGASVSAASGRAVMGWFEPRQRGLALGIRQTAVPVGAAAAALGLPILLGVSGLRAALAALAAACLGAAAAGVLGLREPPGTGSRVANDAGRRGPLRDARLWRLAAGSVCLVCVQIAITSFIVLFLIDERGFSTRGAAAMLAAIQLGGGALRILLGIRSDRVRARVAPLRQLSIGMAVAVGLAAGAISLGDSVLVPAFLLAGALAVGWNGLSFTATAELAGRARSGAALGLQQTALAAGCAVMPVGFAALVAASSWQLGFALLAVLPLLASRILRPLGELEHVTP